MRCPTLNDLPPSPSGRTGWPWTEETPPLLATMPGGYLWPKVSIITPSYNQGQFIEETIRSVLLQGYPDLEYIIIDGGSTDNSLEVIKKYEKWLAYWISEPDRGQMQAINKGFKKATGYIYAWINSDDLYLKNALATATRLIKGRNDRWLFGGWIEMEEARRQQKAPKCPDDLIFWITRSAHGLFSFTQPSIFWTKELWEEAGGIKEELDTCFDLDLFIRMRMLGPTPILISEPLSYVRFHKDCKSRSNHWALVIEDFKIAKMYRNLLYRTRQGKEFYRIIKRKAARSQINRAIAWRQKKRLWRLSEIINAVSIYPGVVLHRQIWKSLIRASFLKKI